MPEAWLTRAEVLALTRWSGPTLARRIKAGRFPASADRGRWCAAAVRAALEGRWGVDAGQAGAFGAEPEDDGWEIDADALAADLAAEARDRKAARGRHVSHPVRGAPRPTPRLAVDNTVAADGT